MTFRSLTVPTLVVASLLPARGVDSLFQWAMRRALDAARYFGLTPQLENGSTDSNIPISRGLPILLAEAGVALTP